MKILAQKIKYIFTLAIAITCFQIDGAALLKRAGTAVAKPLARCLGSITPQLFAREILPHLREKYSSPGPAPKLYQIIAKHAADRMMIPEEYRNEIQEGTIDMAEKKVSAPMLTHYGLIFVNSEVIKNFHGLAFLRAATFHEMGHVRQFTQSPFYRELLRHGAVDLRLPELTIISPDDHTTIEEDADSYGARHSHCHLCTERLAIQRKETKKDSPQHVDGFDDDEHYHGFAGSQKKLFKIMKEQRATGAICGLHKHIGEDENKLLTTRPSTPEKEEEYDSRLAEHLKKEFEFENALLEGEVDL
ncbi:hypothetical protein HN446_00185 [bacterium]|nr:hypothetical protein [bacterium]